MNDFPDWLGPIIVKELRQGLRSKAFVSIFFLLQAAMIFCILMALAASESPITRGAGNSFFWTLVGGVLLVAMPARGLNAISGEIKGNTLELLLLTQLSAWRIAIGKWAALSIQSLLLICTLFPYVVLRYFLGGVDLTGEVIRLGSMLVCGALFTAVAVGISPVAHRPLGRILMALVFIFGINIIPQLLFRGGMGGISTVNPWIWPALSLVLGPLFILLMLEFGVGKIAPPGENVAWRKRLLALGAVIVGGGIAAAFNSWMLVTTLTAIMAVPICVGALLENALPIPSLYQPFRPLKNWPLTNRVAAAFLQPGIATGLLFTIAITATLLVFVKGGNQTVLLGVAALFVPIALARMLSRRYPPFSAYLGIQFLGVVMAILLAQSDRDSEMRGFSCLHPTTAFFLSWFGQLSKNGMHTFVIGFVTVVSFLALVSFIVAAVRERRMINRMRNDEEASETPPSQPVPVASESAASTPMP